MSKFYDEESFKQNDFVLFPRAIMNWGSEFKISNGAKIVYAFLYDMVHRVSGGYEVDEEHHIYVNYDGKDIAEDLHMKSEDAEGYLKELVDARLVERRDERLYILDFVRKR